MSDMRTEGVVRFKIVENVDNLTEFYNRIQPILGDARYLDYKDNWNGVEYVKTEEIEHFSYSRVENTFIVCYDYNNGNWYVDYILASGLQGEDDLKITLGLDELMNIRDKAVALFGSMICPICKIVVYDWYTGSDEPIYF